jgi:hypothetical protein
VGFLEKTIDMICLFLVPISDRSSFIVAVDWLPFSPAVSGLRLVFGLLVCNWKYLAETSMMEGEVSFLGILSLGTYGVVVCDTMTGGSYCSTSTRVFSSHSIRLANFSISGLGV